MLLSYIFFGVLGACLGSYLTAVLDRWHNPTKSWFSQCPRCLHRLTTLDLIPVWSIFLRGFKCKYCKKPISLHYLVLELAMGFLYLGAFALHPIFDLELLFRMLILPLVFVIFVYDLRHFLIPLNVLYCALALTAIYQFLSLPRLALLNVGISALASGAFFLLIYFVSRVTW